MMVSWLLEVILNEVFMVWIVRLKNISEVLLINVKLVLIVKWVVGILLLI